MTWRSTYLLAITLSVSACSHHVSIPADSMSIPHPDDPSRNVEYFLEMPEGKGPWPTVVFIHGYQQSPSAGARDFVRWGVLSNFAKRGYLAVAVSQPGYGGSSGPPDFCGPFTQQAVSAVIEKLRRDGGVVAHKVVIEGISRGALVAGLVAAHDPAHDPMIAGVVLISGLYDLPPFLAGSKSIQVQLMANFTDETGGGSEALGLRSVLNFAGDIKAEALILNGAQDDRTDPSQARRLADEIISHGGKARAIIYPNYGHQIPVEVRDKEIDPFIDKLLYDRL